MDINFDQIVAYEPDTGKVYWRINVGRRGKAGVEVGTITKEGYRRVKIKGQLYLVHRLAWRLTHGVWPTYEIDHIDGDRLNNKLSNLRDVPKALNQRNCRLRKDSASGLVGVRQIYYPNKYWVAQWYDGKRKNRWFSVDKYGEQTAKEMAIKCRMEQTKKLSGYTERHGS